MVIEYQVVTASISQYLILQFIVFVLSFFSQHLLLKTYDQV